MNGNGPAPPGRETAAAIGVALALALQESNAPAGATPANQRWRAMARQEQFFSRNLGSRSWLGV